MKFVSINNWNKHFTFIDFIGEEPIPPQIHHTIMIPNNVNIFESIQSLFDLYNE
jgi:hypothetical protein